MSEDPEERYRSFVFKELISTEQDYVTNLERLMWYYHEMTDPEELPDLRPLVQTPMLKFQGHFLFSNAEEIRVFHTETLLPELENCEDDPTSIAQVFKEWDKELINLYTIYAQYCDARIAVIDQLSKKDKFLMAADAKLEKLKLKVPKKSLNAYTMTPMQRITVKYEMLLMDMCKHTQDEEEKSSLEEAIEAMQNVTKAVNGVKFCPMIIEYPGKDIHTLGRLIMQDEFKIAIKTKGKLDPKFLHRYVLMFQNAVVIAAEQRYTHREATAQLVKAAHEKKVSDKDKEFLEQDKADRTYKIYRFMDKIVLGNFGVAPPKLNTRKAKVYNMRGPSDDVKLKWAEEMFKLTTAGRIKLPTGDDESVDESDY